MIEPKSQDAIDSLQRVMGLMQTAVDQLAGEWKSREIPCLDGQAPIMSRTAFQAQRTLLAATGVITELVSDPACRLMEMSSQYNESRCLHIAAALRFADIFAETGTGLGVEELSARVGIESHKLSRILRCLASNHIFREVRPNVFDNNVTTLALVRNEQLRAYLMLFGLDLYSASDALPKTLLDPEKGRSYDVAQTPWQTAIGTTKPRWDWLEEQVSAKQLTAAAANGYPGIFGPDLTDALEATQKTSDVVPRPEHKIFGQAMVAGGQTFGTAHLYDYPWASLGKAKIVDVGGGVGGFCLQLSTLYPNLSFVVQDRAPALEQAKSQTWPKANPEALASGRVTFQVHDFFNANPAIGADVYWLRYVLHDWSDEYCVQILSAIRKSMMRNSRLVIADQVMNTTIGCEEMESAPDPLPANYGLYTRYSHQRDLTMMSIINGIERTPSEFKTLIERAGLYLSKIYSCRSQVSLIECVLPGVEKTGNNVLDETALLKKRLQNYNFRCPVDVHLLQQKRANLAGRDINGNSVQELRNKRLRAYGAPRYETKEDLRFKRWSYYDFQYPPVAL